MSSIQSLNFNGYALSSCAGAIMKAARLAAERSKLSHLHKSSGTTAPAATTATSNSRMQQQQQDTDSENISQVLAAVSEGSGGEAGRDEDEDACTTVQEGRS